MADTVEIVNTISPTIFYIIRNFKTKRNFKLFKVKFAILSSTN